MQRLLDYEWPGNVRELENAIERACVLGSGEEILPEDLPETFIDTATLSAVGPPDLHASVLEAKRQAVIAAFHEAGRNYTETAKLLGVHPNYLHRLIRNLKIEVTARKRGGVRSAASRRHAGPIRSHWCRRIGGMGEVYKATDTRLNRLVALKVIGAGLAEPPDIRSQFAAEARAVAALNHPHICALYDTGHDHGKDFLVSSIWKVRRSRNDCGADRSRRRGPGLCDRDRRSARLRAPAGSSIVT